MNSGYVRIYKEGPIIERFPTKKKLIAFVKNGNAYERIEKKNGEAIFYSDFDNTKKYYPQNYKQFLKCLEQTKSQDKKIAVYGIHGHWVFAGRQNVCLTQSKSDLIELINFAQGYYANTELSSDKQKEQRLAFVKKCKEILNAKHEKLNEEKSK